MKKIYLTFLISILPFLIFAQCKEFTNNNAVPLLKDFLLSGRYHSMELQEGEEILIFKTVSKGLLYRFVIISSENLPQPHFILSDWEDNVIYDNSTNNFNPIYDIKFDKTQRIKIWIKIPKNQDNPEKNTVEGCVSLVIGIKDTSGEN